MTVTFNHTIVYATDKRHSAEFLANVLGLPKPQAMWSFMTVPLDHGVALDFATADGQSPRSTTHSWSARRTLTEYSPGFRPRAFPTGQTRDGLARSRSTTTTADVASISRILTDISSKRSRVRTDRVLHELLGRIPGRSRVTGSSPTHFRLLYAYSVEVPGQGSDNAGAVPSWPPECRTTVVCTSRYMSILETLSTSRL